MIAQSPQTIQQHQLAKKRILAAGVFILFWACIISARLVEYQVFKKEKMAERAELQQQRTIDLSPKRGSILDRKNRELACSLDVDSIYAAPKEIKDPKPMVKPLSIILGLNEDVVLSRLTSTRTLVSLKRKVTDEESAAVTKLNFEGLHFVKETKRFYPKDSLAAYILGFVGMDEEGFAGVERQYERHIHGRPGYVFVETDARGKPFGRYEKAAEIGQSLVLTVDENIQFRVEKILREEVKRIGARGGTAIVMQPKTGEILAMASTPGFNPNEPVKDMAELHDKRRNRAVEDSYEPGSVFKLVTYSAALEAGLLKPEDKIDCQSGRIEIAGHIVKDGGSYGLLTVSEAVEVSSNVAAIKVGKRLGKARLLKAISDFGFGQSTKVGLPGESPGFIGGTTNWSDASFGALPIGYQVSATPLQLLAAFAAIANGGEWIQPHLLKHIASITGDVLYKPPVETRRVAAKQTAETMKSILEGVVQRGTGKRASLDGYTAAGKTGTARKYDKAIGTYSNTRYFASFCGFAPVERPEIAVIVVVDEPPLGNHHGGQAAAPIFKQISETVLQLLSVAPDKLSPDSLDEKKPLVVENDIPEEEGIWDQGSGVGESATQSNAKAEGSLEPAVEVIGFSVGSGGLVMPDLRGQGVRSALLKCNSLGIRLDFDGSGAGEVAEQNPAPGSAVAPGTTCKVVLKKTGFSPQRTQSSQK